MKISLKNLFQV